MRQFIAIATNAFMELIRQPIFLILASGTAVLEVFLASISYFGFGDEPKLVKVAVLAVMLLAGLFGAVLSASASFSREIRSGTALTVLSKPVGRAQFLLAKFAGVAAALTCLTYISLLGALLASRMAFDAYGSTDWPALTIFCSSVFLAFVAGGFSNFFFRRPFVSDAILSLLVFTTLAFFLINFIDKNMAGQRFGTGIDWLMIPASVLILFAIYVLAGLAMAASTRLDMIPTLGVCSALFLLGLMSDYLFGRPAAQGSWWASVLYTVMPNWQLFWLSDAIENQKQIPWSYLGKALTYMVAYLGATLSLALVLFEDRELS